MVNGAAVTFEDFFVEYRTKEGWTPWARASAEPLGRLVLAEFRRDVPQHLWRLRKVRVTEEVLDE